MLDLGKIQAEVLKRIKQASTDSDVDGHTLGLLGPVAAEMARKAAEWQSLLDLRQNGASPQSNLYPHSGDLNPSGGELAGKSIYAVTILGNRVPVGSYNQALLAVVKYLQAAHPDFDLIAPQVRGRLPYFSANGRDLRKPLLLKNSKLFIETNHGADRIWEICRRLVQAFGHNPDDSSVLRFEVASSRTRAVKGARLRASSAP